MGSYVWKWIPLAQVIFITAPFRLGSEMSLIIPSAMSDGLETETQRQQNRRARIQSETGPAPPATRFIRWEVLWVHQNQNLTPTRCH